MIKIQMGLGGWEILPLKRLTTGVKVEAENGVLHPQVKEHPG